MTGRSEAPRPTSGPARGLTAEERAALRAAVRERKDRELRVDGEHQVREAIAAMNPSDRALAQRVDAIVRANAPSLTPRTWYGMPAYAKDDQVLCYFRPAEKFKTRYATFGFSDAAKLDDGPLWPTDFAVRELTPAAEAKITALVKRAVG